MWGQEAQNSQFAPSYVQPSGGSAGYGGGGGGGGGGAGGYGSAPGGGYGGGAPAPAAGGYSGAPAPSGGGSGYGAAPPGAPPSYGGVHGSPDVSPMTQKERTVYVNNIPAHRSEEDLSMFFSSLGHVVKTRLGGDPMRGTRFAFVEFGSVESAHHARGLSGNLMFDGRALHINAAKAPISASCKPNFAKGAGRGGGAGARMGGMGGMGGMVGMGAPGGFGGSPGYRDPLMGAPPPMGGMGGYGAPQPMGGGFGVGMRRFHLKRNTQHCPTINVNQLWTLVSEQHKARYAKREDGKLPVIDVTQAGYSKVLGAGPALDQPLAVKAKFFSAKAERKIKEAGGVCILTG